MGITRRQSRLVRIIYENPQIGIKELSKQLQVSSQTVKNDLTQLADKMANYHVEISVLPGNQIRLQGQENVTYMLKEFQTMQDFSLEKQAMVLLLLKNDFMTLQDIADALFVSKSLMEKVMSLMIKKSPDEIESVRHYGIRIISSQLERRNSFAELIVPYMKGVDFKRELEDFHSNHFPLLDYIDKEDLQVSLKAIKMICENETFAFTDESISMLFLQLLYIQYSYCHWQHVPSETMMTELMRDFPNDKIYEAAAEKVCQLIQVPETEKSYFAYLFMMLRKQSISDTDFYLKEMQDVLKKIMDRIQDYIAVDFRDDSTLWQGLAVHIYTTVIRRDKLKTSFLENEGEGIRQEYPIGVEMAIIAAEVIKTDLNYTVSNEELIYLTLHFQAAIERMTNLEHNLRIVVVCHYGMAAASLISARLERINSGIKIEDTMSIQKFMALKFIDADLIVSTETIKRDDDTPPVIYVTPMLSSRELKEIKQFAELHCFHNVMMSYIMNADILAMQTDSKSEVLEKAAAYLQEHGKVTDQYVESLLEREKASSTDLGIIAVPHGNPDYVTETKMLIIRLAKPVYWGVSDVQYVFLFAVQREDFSRLALIAQFYKKLSRPSLRIGLQSCENMEDTMFRLSFMHMMGS